MQNLDLTIQIVRHIAMNGGDGLQKRDIFGTPNDGQPAQTQQTHISTFGNRISSEL